MIKQVKTYLYVFIFTYNRTYMYEQVCLKGSDLN